MDIVSLNVNGIRSSNTKGVFEWLRKLNPDVICLQEIRADLDIIKATIKPLEDYYAFFNPASQKGYSGVAIYTKFLPQDIIYGLGDEEIDSEGRYLQIDYKDLSIASIYLPSGTAGEHRIAKKFYFMEYYTSKLREIIDNKSNFIICGDFNIAHREIDLKNWRANTKNSGFLPEERQWLTDMMGIGFIDSWRALYPEVPGYTWWSNRGRAYINDVGWRIDYQFITNNLKDNLLEAQIYKEVKFSDHAPLIVRYKNLKEKLF